MASMGSPEGAQRIPGKRVRMIPYRYRRVAGLAVSYGQPATCSPGLSTPVAAWCMKQEPKSLLVIDARAALSAIAQVPK